MKIENCLCEFYVFRVIVFAAVQDMFCKIEAGMSVLTGCLGIFKQIAERYHNYALFTKAKRPCRERRPRRSAFAGYPRRYRYMRNRQSCSLQAFSRFRLLSFLRLLFLHFGAPRAALPTFACHRYGGAVHVMEGASYFCNSEGLVLRGAVQ